MVKQNKHQKLVDRDYERLKGRDYVVEIDRNIDYHIGKWMGERDVLYIGKNPEGSKKKYHDVYIEHKSNYNPPAFSKAQYQGVRYTNAAWKYDKSMNHYCILVTPQRIQIVAKNGKSRGKYRDLEEITTRYGENITE